MPLDQSVIDRVGLGGDIEGRVAALSSRQESSQAKSDELQQQQLEIAQTSEALGREKTRAITPLREKIAERAQDQPPSEVKEEKIPGYDRPTMPTQDLYDSFAALMAASFLTGIASRGPYNNIMTSMTGAMDGFLKKDAELVHESIKTFDTNLNAIKEKNNQKRREVEDAWTKYSNDLTGLRIELEMIAAKYDDPIALEASRSKTLSEAQKLIDSNIRATETAIDKLEGTRAKIVEGAARYEEAKARRAEANERLEFQRGEAAKRDTERTERLESKKFKDEQALRKEYEKDVGPLRTDLQQVEQILYFTDHPNAFSDIQLRQSVVKFQKGARATNAMIHSMVNFGSLDERIAGRFNRFFEGDYIPEQRGEIKAVFQGLRDQVLKPTLGERDEYFKYLARKNSMDPNAVIPPTGLPPSGGPKTDVPVTVTPR